MSDIEWTDTTWNPVIGCELASPGCALCYAGTMAKRQVAMADGAGRVSPYADVVRVDEPGGKKRTGAAVWNGQTRFLPERLADPLGWRKPRMVFAPSMSDFFHPSVDFEHVAAILGVMAATPQHTYQVLTKRPERLLEFLDWVMGPMFGIYLPSERAVSRIERYATKWGDRHFALSMGKSCPWPLPNVWFGVSVEDQRRADERLPLLADIRAQGWHTFVSAEPLIGPIVNGQWSAADWVIIGGESGSKARRCDAQWMRAIRDDAHAAGTAVFVKQLGLRYHDDAHSTYGAGFNHHLEGSRRRGSVPLARGLKSRKGNDPAEWPADLRVREWPVAMRGNDE